MIKICLTTVLALGLISPTINAVAEDPLYEAMMKEQALMAQANEGRNSPAMDKLEADINHMGDSYISNHISNEKILELMQRRDYDDDDNNNIIIIIPDGWKR